MDNIPNREIFSAILASGILAAYIEKDPALAEMVKSPDHPDIHYYETYATAKQLMPSLKQRLNVMAANNIDHNLEATRKLVAFMEEFSDAQIGNVTFNAPTQHYGVRCGIVNQKLHVICVMTGGHIPNELLGESIK
jgi:hypothetical protein